MANRAPSGADKAITVLKDTPRNFAAVDFGFSDPDNNTFSALIVTELPPSGTLKLNGIDVMAGQSIATADIPNLVWTPPSNANGLGLATLKFQVVDNGGTAGGGVDTDQTSNTITFNVLVPVNGDDDENVLVGGSANERIDGKGDNDVFLGNLAGDELIGGAGDDTYQLDAQTPLSIFEASGDAGGFDTITSSITRSMADFVNIESLTLTGSAAITGIGNAFANRLNGANNSAANMLKGLGGDDVYIVGVGDIVDEDPGGGVDVVVASFTYTLLANVENLQLSGNAANLNGKGNTLDNTLNGKESTTANTLEGLTGNDTYIIGVGDIVEEGVGGGTDWVVADFTYILRSNVENLQLSGNTAIDGTGNNLNNTLNGVINTAANTLTGMTGNDTYIVGANDNVVESANGGTDKVVSAFDHVLSANVENLELSGAGAIDGTGNTRPNQMNGATSSGANVLRGLAGDDVYFVGKGDTVVEASGGGNDIVVAAITYTLAAQVERLQLDGAAAIRGIGNNLNNSLYGNTNKAANVLEGRTGNDTYYIGAGDKVVEAAKSGTDWVVAYVNHTLASNVENLQLFSTANQNGIGNTLPNQIVGNAKNNILDGKSGNDSLFGDAGNDTLIGGDGGDWLVGGKGNDIFRFPSLSHSSGAIIDVIADFDDTGMGNDVIDLAGIYSGKLAYIHDRPYSAQGQVRISDIAGPDLVVEVNTDGDIQSEFVILLKGTKLSEMSASDFVL